MLRGRPLCCMLWLSGTHSLSASAGGVGGTAGQRSPPPPVDAAPALPGGRHWPFRRAAWRRAGKSLPHSSTAVCQHAQEGCLPVLHSRPPLATTPNVWPAQVRPLESNLQGAGSLMAAGARAQRLLPPARAAALPPPARRRPLPCRPGPLLKSAAACHPSRSWWSVCPARASTMSSWRRRQRLWPTLPAAAGRTSRATGGGARAAARGGRHPSHGGAAAEGEQPHG